MPFISPYLEMDRRRTERSNAAFDRSMGLANSLSKGALDLDSLLKEEEDRKRKYEQQLFENQQKIAEGKRSAARDKANADYQTGMLRGQENRDKEAAETNKANRERLGRLDEERSAKDRLQAARDLLSRHVAAGIQQGMTPEQIAQGARETPGLGEITGDEEVFAEYQIQKSDLDKQDRELDIKGERAEAAKITATRPRAAPRVAADNPKFSGLTAGERTKVAQSMTTIEILTQVEDDVRSGRADPGPVSNIMGAVRQFLGIRNSADDATRAQMAGVVNMALNEQFGSAVSAGEMKRALEELPTFKDDQEGFLALLQNLRRKSAIRVNSIVDTATRDAQARNVPTNLPGAFGRIDPMTGRRSGQSTNPFGVTPDSISNMSDEDIKRRIAELRAKKGR